MCKNAVVREKGSNCRTWWHQWWLFLEAQRCTKIWKTFKGRSELKAWQCVTLALRPGEQKPLTVKSPNEEGGATDPLWSRRLHEVHKRCSWRGCRTNTLMWHSCFHIQQNVDIIKSTETNNKFVIPAHLKPCDGHTRNLRIVSYIANSIMPHFIMSRRGCVGAKINTHSPLKHRHAHLHQLDFSPPFLVERVWTYRIVIWTQKGRLGTTKSAADGDPNVFHARLNLEGFRSGLGIEPLNPFLCAYLYSDTHYACSIRSCCASRSL